MTKKTKKKRPRQELHEKKGTLQLLEEIVNESLNPDANLILIEGKVRELEDSDRNYVPLLLKRVNQGKTKEQKTILDLLARRKNAVTTEGLRYIAREPLASVQIRRQAVLQVRKWGESVDEIVLNALEEGEEIIAATERSAQFGEPLEVGLEANVAQRFQKLANDVKTSVIKELLNEYPHGLEVAVKLLRKEEDLDERILSLLVEQENSEVAELLGNLLVETKNNKLRRSIRKFLFQMKNRGLEVTIPSPEEKKPLAFAKMESPQTTAYVTTIDYLGDRLLFLSKSVFGWGMVFFQITLSDQEGIKNLNAYNLNRREVKKFLDRISKDGIIHLIDIPPAYCHFLIEEAYQVNMKKGLTPPEQFSYWKVEIDELKGEVTQPLIYSHLTKEMVEKEKSEAWRSQYPKIEELNFIKDWFLEPRFVWEYVEKFNAVATSPLVLNPYQVEDRKESIVREAVEKIFGDEYRFILKRRLEEMAYIFICMNDHENAKLVLFAADDLGREGLPSSEHGFLKGLVQKSILMYLEDQKDRQRDKFIITPR